MYKLNMNTNETELILFKIFLLNDISINEIKILDEKLNLNET